jgi:hypothetical protein
MAKFNMVVPHGLPQGEALRRIQGEVENLKREYGDKVGNFRDSLDLPPKMRQTVKMQNSANGGRHHGFVSEAV